MTQHMNRGYQENFSSLYKEAAYDIDSRRDKARMIYAVLNEEIKGKSESKTLLDIGTSSGYIDKYLAGYFHHVTGIDIDEDAIEYARQNFSEYNLIFEPGNAMKLKYPDGSFDVVLCNHIYEHVPDDIQLMHEIHRVLKDDGICYFSAGNRLSINEPHYNLPFLSILPRRLAHLYLRLLKRGDFYYERHRSYWGLKSLVERFEVTDYTWKIINDPERYMAVSVIRPGSFKQLIAKKVFSVAPWICPGYIWILKKFKH